MRTVRSGADKRDRRDRDARGHSRLETRDSYNGLNTTIITNRDLGSVSLLCVPSKHPLQHSPRCGRWMRRQRARARERARETLDNSSIFMRFACFDKHSSPCLSRLSRVASCQTRPGNKSGKIKNPKSNSFGPTPKAAGNNLKITFVPK